jgi:nicotinamidase-related amidase
MTASQTQTSLAARSTPHLDYLERWLADRPELPLADIIEQAGGPRGVAIVSTDLIVGFAHQGALASPRVAAILPAVRDLFMRAHAAGIEHVVLTQDTHRPDAAEFRCYPPHCVAGTEESQTAPEIASLPFASRFRIVEKNSIASVTEPAFAAWEAEIGPPRAWIVVGDCTDICVHQAAMALQVRSLGAHLGQRVVVPADCVATYDLPVETALAIGAQPHHGDLLHHVFLHSMAQNGVEVVARIV